MWGCRLAVAVGGMMWMLIADSVGAGGMNLIGFGVVLCRPLLAVCVGFCLFWFAYDFWLSCCLCV